MAAAAPVEKIDIGRVIGRGFEALRANFLAFFACALLLTGAPSFFMQYWLLSEMGAADDPEFFLSLRYWGPVVGALLLTMVTGALLQGVLVRSTILQLSGRQADFAHSLTLALRLLVPMILVSIIVTLLTVLGFMLLIVPGIMIYCAFLVSVPALIEERRGVFGSMRRSRDLTRGSRMRIFLLLIIFWIFSIIISGLLGLIGGAPIMGPDMMQVPDPILAGATSGIASALTSVIVAVALAALYVELRTVKEGATTDDLAAIFE